MSLKQLHSMRVDCSSERKLLQHFGSISSVRTLTSPPTHRDSLDNEPGDKEAGRLRIRTFLFTQTALPEDVRELKV